MKKYFFKLAEVEDNASEGAGLAFMGGPGTPVTDKDSNSHITDVTLASFRRADIAGAIGNAEVGAVFSGADGGGATTLADQDSGLSGMDAQGTRSTSENYKKTPLNQGGFFHPSASKTALQGAGFFTDQGAGSKRNDPTALKSKDEVEAQEGQDSPSIPGGYASTLSMIGGGAISDPMGGMTHGSSIYFGLNEDQLLGLIEYNDYDEF